jgi:hypothetical protein
MATKEKVKIMQQYTNMGMVNGYLGTGNVDNGVSISCGKVSGRTYVHKFGECVDVDTGDNTVTMWDGADDANIDAMNYTYSTTADIDAISSNKAADTQTIEIQGLKTGYVACTLTATLNGTAKVSLATTLIRVFRMRNTATTSNTGHVYCYVTTAITSGVPDAAANVRAIIQPTLNQTLMSLYTIPAGKTGFLRRWRASSAGGSRASNYQIDLRVRPEGECFQLKDRSSISDDVRLNEEYDDPEKIDAKSDVEMQCRVLAAAITGASVSGGFDIMLEDN